MVGSCIAAYITPHGYGHAARTCAILESLQRRFPDLRVEIFTQVPTWFFEESLIRPFGYHSLACDVGLVQSSPLDEDIPATLKRLAEFLPFHPDLLAQLAAQLTDLNCQLVLCDVAALGIAVAHTAGIPSVLVENFTWDWIYQAYQNHYPALSGPIAYLRNQYSQADHHLQTEPAADSGLKVDLITNPVARAHRQAAALVRSRLGIQSDLTTVLVTMGGMSGVENEWKALPVRQDLVWVIPNGAEEPFWDDNRLLLPHHSAYYHPDLLNACDAVVGKTGYSTLAETFMAGLPFAYISRKTFPESAILARFIQAYMRGFELIPDQMDDPAWLSKLLSLARQPRRIPPISNGAEQAADFLQALL